MVSSKCRGARLLLATLLSVICLGPAGARDTYCWRGGRRIDLTPNTGMVAVRLTPDAVRGLGRQRLPLLNGLYDTKKSRYADRWGVAIMAPTVPGVLGAAQLERSLLADPKVQTELPVYRGDGSYWVDFGRLVVQFREPPSSTQLATFLARYGVQVCQDLHNWLPGAYVLALTPNNSATGVSVANEIAENERVIFSEPDFLHNYKKRGHTVAGTPKTTVTASPTRLFGSKGVRSPRLIPTDPDFGYQWHLQNTGYYPGNMQTGGLPGADVNATAAWNITLGSKSVVIAIIDDGIDIQHEDLKSQYVTGTDLQGGTSNPMPTSEDEDGHGTAVAGMAVATEGNGKGGCGVAPGCGLMAIRLLGPNETDDMDAEAFRWAAIHGASVINCSWGPGGLFGEPWYTTTNVDAESDGIHPGGRGDGLGPDLCRQQRPRRQGLSDFLRRR